MAKISDYLNKIRTAIYGKDVRQALYDGLDIINKETEKTSVKQQHLEDTFHELIINAGNSNAEIVDARVDKNNGNKFEKIGDRLDQYSVAFEQNKNELNTLKPKVDSLASGSPKGTFATLSALQGDTNANTTEGKKSVYVVTADGGWYYWNGTAWTKGGTYQSSGIADNSITKSKLSPTISLNPIPFLKSIIQKPDFHLNNLPTVYNGVAEKVIPSAFSGTDYSIKYTPTDLATNYVWVADLRASAWDNLTALEKNNTENKVTVSFVYSYGGASALTLRGRVYFEDGTTESRNWGAIVVPASNKILTLELIESRPIVRGYVYVDMPQTEFRFTNATAYYGGAINNTDYKVQVDDNLKKLEIKTNNQDGMLNTILKYKNWCAYTEDMNNGFTSEINQTNVDDWNNLGNVEIADIINSAGTNRWVRFGKNTTNAKPFMQIRANSNMLTKLVELEQSSAYNNDAWIDVDIVIDSADKVNLTVQALGRLGTTGWVYFRNIPINHNGGKVKYTRKLYIEYSYMGQNKFRDLSYLATYIVFDNAFTNGNIYFGNITNYCDKQIAKKLILIEGKQIEKNSISIDNLNNNLQELLLGEDSTSIANNSLSKPMKAAYVGDSVTWGDGGLNDGYLGVIDSILRRKHTNLVDVDSVAVTGTKLIINSPKFFENRALSISGVNSYIEFEMKSDKLIISRAMNRNNKGASICELLVDGVVYDTFANYNPNPKGNQILTFTADGVARKFQLGKAFTYNHTVTLDGVTLKGKLNNSGYGALFPTGDDYMIIRAIDNGEVNHTLFFRNAPTSGTIIVSFDYGESITYAKTSVGEIGVDLNSGIESYYGDGAVAFDPSNAVSLSSGLDFRYVNKESFLVYNFAEEKTRNIKIRIKSLDPRANSINDAPIFIFNFATSCDYQYMNAGIGGYKYSLFNNTNNVTTCYKKFMEYEPDIITMLLGTNDDWDRANYPISQDRTVNSSWLEENSLYWCDGTPTKTGDNYLIKDRWLDIKAFDKYSITLADSVNVGSISKNDILLINKWVLDERYTQTRLISSYDSATKKITFLTPINTEKISLDTKVFVKSLSRLGTDIDIMVSNIKSYDHLTPKVYIACMGVPNMNHRQLLGYREYLKYMANKHKIEFIDLFTPTSEYQAKTSNYEIMKITSTGASEYTILINGNNIDPILRNVEVFVDGINIFDGINVTLCGGYGMYHNSDLTNGYKVTPTKIKFKTPIPVGKEITVKGTTTRYSSDYCHMNNDIGKYLYGKEIVSRIIS